jgi:hypothetical protein
VSDYHLSFHLNRLDICLSVAGIFYALGGIGIGLGFLATSQFLKVYTHIKKPLWLTPIYSEWVGAWWLVYALGTCISLMLCSFLCLFDFGRARKHVASQKEISSTLNPTYQLLTPTTINQTDSIQTSRLLSSRTSSSTTNFSATMSPSGNESVTIVQDQTPKLSSAGTNEENLSTSTRILSFYHFFDEILSLIKDLLLNLRYMGITCCAIIEALLIKGYLAFLSKHIEYQFRTTSSHSSVYIGVISLFSVSRLLLSSTVNSLSSFFLGYFWHTIRRVLRQTIRYEWPTMCQVLLYHSGFFICDLSRINPTLP